MSISHYTIPIPSSAAICPDWPSLCEEVLKWPDSVLDKKYGGYVIEDNNTVVLACTDNLCTILEEKDKEAMTITFHDPANLPSDVSIANYTVPIPESARIVSKYPSLEAAALQRPHAPIVKKYGGYVIEEDGIIVIACDDNMSGEIETHPGCLDNIFEDVAELKRTKGGRRGSSAL